MVWFIIMVCVVVSIIINSYCLLFLIAMFSYCYFGCLVYIGWYILGVCSVGVQGCGVVWWCGVWVVGWCVYYSIAIIYYYVWDIVGVVCVVWYVLFTFISMYWYIVVVGVVCVYGVGCMCICYVYYILYYIVVCILCLCCQYHVTHQLVSICQCVGYCLDTTQRQVVPPQCCVLVRHNIDTNKIKNQHKLNTS